MRNSVRRISQRLKDQRVCCQHLLYHKSNQLQSLSEDYPQKSLSLSLENAEENFQKPLIFRSFIVFESSEALNLLSVGLPKWFVLYSFQ
ncbi:hypothetical protein E3N88_15916 [Mikania micrantha]|uniref:Uncharacterized protein n=1 Tax=Mikania micrantha TaxID=192012 RepID=A0A5N6NZJ2_9ASTR|nr:hypothetical protein E3N88_15916 [Mikania micrantha]